MANWESCGHPSTLAMHIPSDKLLNTKTPESGPAFWSSMVSIFLSVPHVAGVTLSWVTTHGKLVLDSTVLKDNGKVAKHTDVAPGYGFQKYDPIN